ncbi:MAG: hypothetical protein SFY80_15850 [Verrucomicrobiota bacterium]|nr:hypothetical protein [Verrucomicrobiota bacterium]
MNNWDGSYWQLFTREKKILNMVVSNAEENDWNWRLVDFEREYPDPSDVAILEAVADYQKHRCQPDAALNHSPAARTE